MKTRKKLLVKLTAGVCAGFSIHAAWGQEKTTRLDEVSVTATRESRATKEVPQAIVVIGEEQIKNFRMDNLKDALGGIAGVQADSKNGGYDTRLIIRGAGQKPSQAITEIMILRDGVPLTDAESSTLLETLDTQDIEKIEVSKGPGNIYNTGTSGGTVQIFSKSVFDSSTNAVKAGLGEQGSESYHLRYGGMVSPDQALAITASRRTQENSWRQWNRSGSDQISLKHGLMLGGNATWESELSYAAADQQRPGSMSEAQFAAFVQSGEQPSTQDVWKHTGRYSSTWSFNTRYEQEMGAWTIKPRLYLAQSDFTMPNIGYITETVDAITTVGAELEAHHRHRFGAMAGTLVAGLTLKNESSDDQRRYEYRDVQKDGTGKIIATLSDARGKLAIAENSQNTLHGVFAQENLRLSERLLVDVGFRLDKSSFELNQNEITKFNGTTMKYQAGAGFSTRTADFSLFSPKIGASYKLAPRISLYTAASQSEQAPSTSDMIWNPDLKAPRSRNYEIGLKGRAEKWSFDAAYYVNPVDDQIVRYKVNTENVVANAGKTDRKGFEFSGSYHIAQGLKAGVSYSWTEYTYADFVEVVNNVNVNRSGNRVPYVPENQYALFADYRHPSGFVARGQVNTWGSYYVDNANSAQYDGYELVTSLMLGYRKAPHSLTLNVDNLFDKRYAMEVTKDATGKIGYYAGAPRTAMLTYQYAF